MSIPTQFRRIGFDDVNDRDLFVMCAANAADLPELVTIGSRYFVSLIICDARSESTAALRRLARTLLNAGCVYFCCWGPECQRVHDIVDEEYLPGGISIHDDHSTIMTTWHDSESLDEAVWFSLNVALPDDRFFDECSAVVAVCIGSASWAEQVIKALGDPRGLVVRVVN
jgi:hypothetical protein